MPYLSIKKTVILSYLIYLAFCKNSLLKPIQIVVISMNCVQERLDRGVIVLKPKRRKQQVQRSNLKSTPHRRKTLSLPEGIISNSTDKENIDLIFIICF